jgi:hypothetical protein
MAARQIPQERFVADAIGCVDDLAVAGIVGSRTRRIVARRWRMIRKGTRVERLTKKVGQHQETGRVASIHDDYSVKIEWDDGHTSIVSNSAVIPVTDASRPNKGV